MLNPRWRSIVSQAKLQCWEAIFTRWCFFGELVRKLSEVQTCQVDHMQEVLARPAWLVITLTPWALVLGQNEPEEAQTGVKLYPIEAKDTTGC